MKMTASEIVLKDMCSYLEKVRNKPHSPKQPKGVKADKAQEFWWNEFHHREVRAVEAMIFTQELRIERGREKLSRDSEAEGDEAKQDQELPKDSGVRTKEKGQDAIRSFLRNFHHTRP